MPIKPSGPVPAKVMIVGEMPGEQEDMLGVPFVGASGKELKRMLTQAGIDPKTCFMTNVFMTRPKDNKVEEFCGKRAEVAKSYSLPPLSTGNYVLEEHLHELERLRGEIERVNPSLIIAVGNTPCWALLQRTGIGKLRGSVFPCALAPGFSVLPTYHPAAILRDWSLRPVAVADLMKAERAVREGLKQIRRELVLAPTIEEVREYLQDLINNPPPVLPFDIETMQESITCIGFARSTTSAITVPFFDPTAEGKNYWPTKELELEAYYLCKAVLESACRKLGQNGLYDIQYLWWNGIRVRNYLEDTMIRHHSLYPELEKGLGFMASIYTDEAPWKVLRDRNKDNFKLDDDA